MPPDQDADFRALVETHGPVMYRQAYRLLGNRQDAEDAVQEALVRIWKHRGGFDHRAQLSTWIFRVTYNACGAVRERRARYGRFEDGIDESPHPPAQPPSPDDMARMLSLLPEREAAALSLHYVEQLGYKEIAEVLRIPVGTVATAIHRGKSRLRRLLKEGR